MMEFVWARPQDEDALLDFINLVFSVGGTPTDFRSLIPKVYGKGGFSANSLLARDAAGIKGVVSYTQGSLAMGNGELAYGFVGNVSAHPYLRGQGIMQTLMPRVLERLKEDGCDFTILGGQRQRYQHFGYELCGGRMTIHVTGRSLRHALAGRDAPAIRFTPLAEAAPGEVEQAWAMHRGGALYCQRSLADFPVILRTWQGQTFLAHQGDELLGYVYLLGGRVAEFRVKDAALLPHLLSALMTRQNLQQLEVNLRADELSAHQALFDAADSWEQGPVYMAHVFNWQRFLSVLLDFKAGMVPLMDGEAVLDIQGEGRLLIAVVGGQPRVSPAARPADLSVTPQDALRLTTLPFQQELFPGHPFRNWFPLPFDFPDADAF